MTIFQLVEQNKVTTGQLIEAVIEQHRSLKSSIDVSLASNLLDAQQIIEAIASCELGETIEESCVRLGHISKATAEQIRSLTIEATPSAYQLLGCESLAGSTPATASSNSAAEVPATEQSACDVDSLEVIKAPAFNDIEFEFHQVSNETRQQYTDFFSPKLKKDILDCVASLESGHDDANNIINLEEKAQQITAAASFARMDISNSLADKFTSLIEAISEGLVKLDDSRENIHKTSLKAVDVLWELHRFIEISGSEMDFWKNEESRRNYQIAITSIDHLLAKQG